MLETKSLDVLMEKEEIIPTILPIRLRIWSYFFLFSLQVGQNFDRCIISTTKRDIVRFLLSV